MLMRCVVVLSLCLIGSLVVSAQQVATVSSSKPFQIRGVTVPVSGIPAWPVAVGDEIVTGTSPVTVMFSDSSRVTLAAKSKAKIDNLDERLTLRLFSGSFTYSVASASGIQFVVGNRTFPIRAGAKGYLSFAGGSVLHGSSLEGRQGLDDNEGDREMPPVSKYKKPRKKKE